MSSHALRSAEKTRADVLLLELNGQKVVLKDYTNSNPGFSMFVGPFLTWRESKALHRLQGLDGVPELVRKVSYRAILIEYIPSRRLRQAGQGFDWVNFINQAEQLTQSLHQRGVVHGDLRNATNILIDEKDRPVFVDLVSAVHQGSSWNPLTRWIFSQALILDRGAVHKLKMKYAPQMVSAEEIEKWQQKGVMERVARKISMLTRKLISVVFRI